MNKAQHLILLLAFWLALTDMARTQQEDERSENDGFVQFNDEDNFLQQDGRKEQQHMVKLKQILQQMLRSGIRQPVKGADEDYSQDYEDANADDDNATDAEYDADTETYPDDDADIETDPDSGNETENNSDAGGDADPGTDSNFGSYPGSDSGIDVDNDTFYDDDFEYNPYTNSFNEQFPDGTYVYGYALPHGVRRYERAFYSDTYKGLVVEGFSTEPRQRGQRMAYELRCYRSDAYGYRPLKVEYLNRPPTVQRDVEPNVNCFN